MNHQVLKAIAKILIETAGSKNVITYGDVSRRLGGFINPRNLDQPLGELSELAIDNGYPKISALVVNQDTQMPGDGYFKYFYTEIPVSRWEEIWLEDIQAIYSFVNWREFIELI